MALPAGGSYSPTVSAYEGGERVGGKLVNRSNRRNRATPYDRPLAVRGSSWISKVVVDPAKKLIAASVRRFLSSVLNKRLPPPPPTLLLPAPGDIPEFCNGLQDPVQQNEVLHSDGVDSHYVTTEDSNVPPELLQLLKRSTFTRPEVDRLTKLLESKALDLPVPNIVMEHRKQEQCLKDLSFENWRGSDQSHAVLEEDITFATLLAKEYMSSQISRGSQPLLSYRDRGINEDGDLSNGVPSVPVSNVMSLAAKTSRRMDDPENSLIIPRFRARSAIHEMASSRIHTPLFHRGSGSSGKRSAPPTLLKQDGELGWKESSRKRSSAVLEDFGSGGTFRRIRRKYGLLTHEVDLPFGENYNACSGQPFSLTHKRSYMDSWRHNGSKLIEGVENTSNSSTRSSHLSSKSSEHAAKVKVIEANLAADRQRTPFKLTEDMLSGKALKSLVSLDSLIPLQTTLDGGNLEESLRDVACTSRTQNEAKENVPEKSHLQLEVTSQTQNAAEVNGSEKSFLQHDFTIQKQSEPEEHCQGKSLFQLGLTSLKRNGADENGLERPHPEFDTTFYMDSDRISGSSAPSASRTISVAPKKHAFMMSVIEDFIDMDEDAYCNGPASEALLKEKEENKTLLDERNPCTPGKSVLDRTPSLPETRKAPPEPVTMPDTSSVSVGGDGTIASVSLPLQSGPCHPSSGTPEKLKDVESPLASILEASQPKFSPSIQPEPSRPIRLGDAADMSLQAPESGKHEVNIPQDDVNANKNLETKSSVVFTTSVSTHSSTSVLPDPVHLNPSTISSTPSLVSTIFANQASTDATTASSTAVSIPVGTDTFATSSGLVMPTLQPSVPSVSPFTFVGSGKTSNASVPSVSTASDKPSTAPVSPVFTFMSGGASGKTSNASVPASSTETSVIKKEADISQPQDAGNESTLSTKQSIEVGTGAATPFSSGTSGMAPFIANTASSSSSSSVTNLFGSVPSFGPSSATTSLSEIKPITPASNGLPSSPFVFSSTVSSGPKPVTPASNGISSSPFVFSSTVSSGPSAVSSSSGSMLSVFSSKAGSSGTTSSAATGMFTFGATSSTSMPVTSTVFGSTPNSAPFGAGFNPTPSNVFAPPTIPATGFGASPTPSVFTNNDQMNGEDCMAEDQPVQSQPPAGFYHQPQQPAVPQPAASGFPFLSTAPPAAPLFGGGQQIPNPVFPVGGGQQTQNPVFPVGGGQQIQNLVFPVGGGQPTPGQGGVPNNPFQPFSSGSTGGGDDKTARRHVRVNRNNKNRSTRK